MEFPKEFLHSHMIRGKYLFRGAFHCDQTVIHKDNPIGDVTGKAHLVGNDHHGDMLGCQVFDYFQDFASELRVQS